MNAANAYTAQTIEPALAQWPTHVVTLNDARWQRLRESARRRLLVSCQSALEQMRAVAAQAGVPDPVRDVLGGNPDTTAILMTGHQPVIFHSGLTFKYQITEAFADEHSLIGVAVVIDTDEGDAGEFQYPRRVTEGTQPSRWPAMEIARETLALESGLYRAGRMRSAADLARVVDHVAGESPRSRGESGLTSFRTAISWYARLSGCSMAEANIIVRRAAGIGSRLLELPLSEICTFPEVTELHVGILERPRDFADCCNAALESFRKDENIRNVANPFPNLRMDATDCELPFWIVDKSRTARRIARTSDAGSVSAGDLLVPRGPLISATLRLLFSDIFVHGLGGGSYDRFTDRLIRDWWHVTPPPFTVVSASRYLSENDRIELLRLQDLESRMRELQFHPQREFGTGLFQSDDEAVISDLLRDKDNAVARLQQVRQSGESARAIAAELQQCGDRIKAAVTNAIAPSLQALQSTSKETQSAIVNRQWPWFFFEPSV